MTKRIIVLALVSVFFISAASVHAKPQPGFVSGTMNSDELVRIFGDGFGQAPEGEVPSVPGPSSVLGPLGVTAGTGPDWNTCQKYHRMPLETWTPTEISFRFAEGKIPELTEFYLFVVDAEGQASAGIGPWMVGEGILPSSGNRIPLRDDGTKLLPDFERPAAPASSESGPGQPEMREFPLPSESPLAVPVDSPRWFFLQVAEGGLWPELLGEWLNEDQRPRAMVGNNPNQQDCAWLIDTTIFEVSENGLICPGSLPEAVIGQSVYIFSSEDQGQSTAGLTATVSDGWPGMIPPGTELQPTGRPVSTD